LVRSAGPDYELEIGQRGGYISRYRWLQANPIVHRVPQTLFAAKVTLRRLNAHMTE
jgi:hypothetical protein